MPSLQGITPRCATSVFSYLDGSQAYAERKALRAEVRALAKEERKRQQLAVGEVLSHARVVCATLTGVLARDIAPLKFDLVVVDEAAQVCPAAPWHAAHPGSMSSCCNSIVDYVIIGMLRALSQKNVSVLRAQSIILMP